MCLLTRLFFNQSSTSVILAKAGIQLRTQDFIGRASFISKWIPACAGMTGRL